MVLFELPLTYVADKIINSQKQKIASLIDDKTATYIQIKEYIQPAWARIQEPIALSSDPLSWLKVETSEIHMSPLMGRAGLIQSSVGMKAYLHYVLGEKPQAVPKPLPALEISNDGAGYFNLSVLSEISYAYAKELAKKYFEGQEFSFSNGKKKIKIEEVDLYGSQGKMVIGLAISGSLKGKIFLSGVPYYDAASKSIRVKETDFDVDTRNKLVKSANWLAHNVFLKKIESYLTIPIGENIKESEKLVEDNIANKKIGTYITIDGRVIQIAPEVIFLTGSGIGTVITGKGILNVKITP